MRWIIDGVDRFLERIVTEVFQMLGCSGRMIRGQTDLGDQIIEPPAPSALHFKGQILSHVGEGVLTCNRCLKKAPLGG